MSDEGLFKAVSFANEDGKKIAFWAESLSAGSFFDVHAAFARVVAFSITFFPTKLCRVFKRESYTSYESEIASRHYILWKGRKVHDWNIFPTLS